MSKPIISQYTIQELKQIASLSESFADFSRKLGYAATSGDQYTILKQIVANNNIDISHFIITPTAIKRTRENVFIEGSTADQSTLRRFYCKEDVPYVCAICGQEPFWNGKEMTLILDHINGKNHDNRLENLRWVCPNCNIQLPTTNRRKETFDKKYYCVDCGKEISKHAIRCLSCNGKYQATPVEGMKVSREDLKTLIRTTPFTKIGAQYSVSDNAIRKWCIKYELPYKQTDIAKYSDEEWEDI